MAKLENRQAISECKNQYNIKEGLDSGRHITPALQEGFRYWSHRLNSSVSGMALISESIIQYYDENYDEKKVK